MSKTKFQLTELQFFSSEYKSAISNIGLVGWSIQINGRCAGALALLQLVADTQWVHPTIGLGR